MAQLSRLALRCNHLALSVLRRWPRPALRKVHRFRPKGTTPGALDLVVLTTPRYWTESLWAAYSWLHFFPSPLNVNLFVDGTPTDRQRFEFHQLFPGAHLATPPTLDRSMSSPALDLMLQHHRFGRKLNLLLALNQKSPLLFTDSDVLCFRRPDELVADVANGGPARFLREQSYEHVDPWIQNRARAHGIEQPPKFNSGVLYLPQGALSLPLARELTETWTVQENHLLTEQTLLAALLAAAGGTALPSDRYLTSWDGMITWRRDRTDLSSVVMRHYCGVVRHRFYAEGLPWLLRRLGRTDAQPNGV